MRQDHQPRPIGLVEFVAMIAAMMAINALGVDTMLPALPDMARALHIAVENDRQYIIAAYVFGFGVAHLVYGPMADRFGRRPVLMSGLALFVVACIATSFAYDLHSVVLLRALQGIAAAATRVLATSIVRDRFEGRTMARVMSLAFIVFLAVPILAPSLGQLILLVGPWQWIFYFLAGFGVLLLGWVALRLPETLDPANRREIHLSAVAGAFREVILNRISLGYAVASACLFGSLMGFINTVQQIFTDVFHRPEIFTIVFAISASAMGAASFLNSRIVERVGTRRVSHSALVMFLIVTTAHLLVAAGGYETVASFAIFQASTLFCFALAGSNFSAMAMEPVGHMAGTAASAQGAVGAVAGSLIGLAISRRFDGTILPTLEGYVVLGLAALLIVLFTERWKLFQSHHAPAACVAAQ